MPGTQLATKAPSSRLASISVQYFVHMSVIFLCAGELVPGVNESHYLVKAKHAWDASFAAGGDIFLESHDSHWLSTALAGLAARVMPLSVVAWLGRWLSWSCMSLAWIHLTERLRIPGMLRPLALITWFLAVKYGHWAGEWAIGGFEAKSLAYPCVLMALAGLAEVESQGSWSKVWLWLGLAVAWHPLVGGWAGLSVGLLWLGQPNLWKRWKLNAGWIFLAAALALVGLLPAAAGLGGADTQGPVAAPQVHVYLRLAHHMCPRMFAVERHWAALAASAGSGNGVLYLVSQRPGQVGWNATAACCLDSRSLQYGRLGHRWAAVQYATLPGLTSCSGSIGFAGPMWQFP